jgi:multidrug efflux pump subunit AcrA (membrane-fusion protein)
VLFSRIQSKQAQLQAEQEAALKTSEPQVNVVTLELLPQEMTDKINFPGTIIPFMEVNVLAEVRGRVTKRLVDQGVVVKKGDVLVTLDSRDYQNQLTASKASYQAALAHKNRIEKLYHKKLATRSKLF